MKSNEYYLGLVVGIIVAAVLIVVVFKALKKNEPDVQFDERQLMARGNAFRAGFFGTLIADAAAIVFCTAVEISWLPPAILFAVAAFIGIGIFCISAINNDAYFGFNQNIKTSAGFMVFVGALNLVIGILSVIRGGLIEDGTLNGSILNLIVGFFFLIIFAVIIIHSRNSEAEGEE